MHRALSGGIRPISDFFKPVRESVYQRQCDKTLDAIKESQRLAAIKLAESTAAKKNRRRVNLAQVLADLCLGMGPRRTNTEQDEDEEARMLRDLDLDEEIEENEADDE